MTTIKYGISGELTKDFGSMTVGELVRDKNILGVLGAPESVTAISGGETIGSDELVDDYVMITLDKQASSKA